MQCWWAVFRGFGTSGLGIGKRGLFLLFNWFRNNPIRHCCTAVMSNGVPLPTTVFEKVVKYWGYTLVRRMGTLYGGPGSRIRGEHSSKTTWATVRLPYPWVSKLNYLLFPLFFPLFPLTDLPECFQQGWQSGILWWNIWPPGTGSAEERLQRIYRYMFPPSLPPLSSATWVYFITLILQRHTTRWIKQSCQPVRIFRISYGKLSYIWDNGNTNVSLKIRIWNGRLFLFFIIIVIIFLIKKNKNLSGTDITRVDGMA